jgi:hypothetical protein
MKMNIVRNYAHVLLATKHFSSLKILLLFLLHFYWFNLV